MVMIMMRFFGKGSGDYSGAPQTWYVPSDDTPQMSDVRHTDEFDAALEANLARLGVGGNHEDIFGGLDTAAQRFEKLVGEVGMPLPLEAVLGKVAAKGHTH